MNDFDDISLRIRQYLKGELSEEERDSFEAMMAKQPELQEEVAFTRSLIHVTERTEKQRLLQLLENANPDVATAKTDSGKAISIQSGPLFRKYIRIAAAAAAVLLLAIAGWWLFQQDEDPLYSFRQEAYISPVFAGVTVKGTSDNTFSRAYRLYQAGQYEESITGLREMAPSDSLYFLSLSLTGHNQYLSGNYREARSTFEKLTGLLETSAPNTLSSFAVPNPENVKWTRLLCMLSTYEDDPSEQGKNNLMNELDQFVAEASPHDTYYDHAQELKQLLSEQ